MAELSEGFILSLHRQSWLDHLQAAFGPETWKKLQQEGVQTVWDVALLPPARLQQIAKDQQLDEESLSKFAKDCKVFVDFAQDV